MSIDSVLRAAALGQPEAFGQMVEITCHAGRQRVGGDEAALLAVYQCMAEHLHEVRPATSFWSWFDQIAGAPRPATTMVTDPGLKNRLMSGIDPLVFLGRNDTLGQMAARFTLSGWMPAFLTSLTLALGLSSGEAQNIDPKSVPPSLFFALIAATLFMVILGPLLSSWRRSLWRASFLPSSMVLSLGLVIWSLLGMTAVPFVMAALDKTEGFQPVRYLVLGLDHAFAEVALYQIGVAWFVGLVACLCGRRLLQSHRWVLVPLGSLRRRLLMLPLLLPPLWSLLVVAQLYFFGARLEPEMEAQYGPEIAIAKDVQDGFAAARSPALLAQLPARFREQPDINSWLSQPDAARTPEQWRRLGGRWSTEVDARWHGKGFWRGRALRAMVKTASFETMRASGWSLKERVSIGIRGAVILAGDYQEGYQLGLLVEQAQIPAADWDRLIELSLQRDDLGCVDIQLSKLHEVDFRPREVGFFD